MSAAPETSFSPFDPAQMREPYDAYRKLRDETPVALVRGIGAYLVTRYAGVEEVFLDATRLSSAAMATKVGGESGPEQPEDSGRVLQTTDPPDHDELRRIVNRGFTPRTIEALRARAREVLAEGLAAVAGDKQIDLVECLASFLPIVMIAELLGIDRARHRDFKRWSDDIAQGMWAADPTDSSRAQAELAEHIDEVVARRLTEPGRDVISKLIHATAADDGILAPHEIVAFTVSLLVAGGETTTNLIANLALALIEEPEAAQAVRDDRSLVPAFVEETLRHNGPVQILMRRAVEPVEIGGVAIPAGAMVVPVLGSANRDERRFDAPDEFRLDRSEPAHLAFGQGVHFCLGAALSRLEAQEALEQMLEIWPTLRWKAEPYENVPSLLMRGPRRLLFERI